MQHIWTLWPHCLHTDLQWAGFLAPFKGIVRVLMQCYLLFICKWVVSGFQGGKKTNQECTNKMSSNGTEKGTKRDKDFFLQSDQTCLWHLPVIPLLNQNHTEWAAVHYAWAVRVCFIKRSAADGPDTAPHQTVHLLWAVACEQMGPQRLPVQSEKWIQHRGHGSCCRPHQRETHRCPFTASLLFTWVRFLRFIKRPAFLRIPWCRHPAAQFTDVIGSLCYEWIIEIPVIISQPDPLHVYNLKAHVFPRRIHPAESERKYQYGLHQEGE